MGLKSVAGDTDVTPRQEDTLVKMMCLEPADGSMIEFFVWFI